MKILTVDDEKKLAHLVRRWLRQEGYIVDILFDGKEALNFILANHETLDLVILDEMLPNQQGSEICRLVRDHEINIPILMLTAKDLDNDIVSGLHAGADDYLTKPFSLAVLSARVKALLRRPNRITRNFKEIKIGPLSLNPATHKVMYHQKELSLTLKEYNVLEYLMEHPNTVIEREELLEKVWDVNASPFSNVVDVQITRLRKKLKEVNNTPIVETVRGVGFRLKA